MLSLRLLEMKMGFKYGVELRYYLSMRFLNMKVRRLLSKLFINASNYAGYT